MLFVLLFACNPDAPPATIPSTEIALGELRTVVPAAPIPASVSVQTSNNNLDVVDHTDGRLYFAFRTGPSHFASDAVQLIVLSSGDGGDSWKTELVIDRDTDLREPRFLSLDGRLILHYAVLGTNPLDFEPQGTMRTVLEEGEWQTPHWVFDDGFIPWRTRVIDGQPTMIGYTGGDAIYDQGDAALPALEVRWLESNDGLDWTGDTVWVGGASETDFTHTSTALVAVMRNEAGDEDGFGSKVCRADLDAPTDWECIHDCRKFDSPLMFTHDDEAWLIARRNLNDDGCFDLGLDPTEYGHTERFTRYSAAYWQHPKRCTVWHVNAVTLAVTPVVDLPSAGDTCFPSILDRAGGYEVWNYTSDPTRPSTPWLEGQQSPTVITRQRMRFVQ